MERVLQNCGDYAEIIELLSDGRCRVRFDSGFEKECKRQYFVEKKVLNKISTEESSPTFRYVGERLLQMCGEWAEIIELLPKNRCIVRFDDGVEKECDRAMFSKKELQKIMISQIVM